MRLRGGPLGVVAARHRDHDLGRARPRPRPSRRCADRSPAGRARRAAGELDHLRHPVAGEVERVEPLERGDARPARARDGAARTALDAALAARRPALSPASPRPLRRPAAGSSAQHLAERRRVERDDLGPLGSRPADGAHVVEGDGADLADCLGDDQVRRRAPPARPRRARRAPRRARCARGPRGRSRRGRQARAGSRSRVRCGQRSRAGG